MKNLYLFQPQFNHTLNETVRYWIPYSVGCLWAYAKQQEEISKNWVCRELFFKREPLSDVVNRMSDPHACAFSTYMWNEKYNLAMAEKIKARWPDCVILFGGPQVTAEYLRYDFVDSIMMGEGELQFVDALLAISQEQSLPVLYPKKRIETLESLPSPYLAGVFDDIIKNNPDYYWNVVFETNRGCPFQCTFCDWGSLTLSKIKKFGLDKIQAELDWFKAHPVTHVFLADANFGIFKERDMEISRMIRSTLTDSMVDYIMITWTKNSNESVFEMAKVMGELMKSVTVSQQSMGADTLKAIKRENMKSNDFKNIVALSKKYDVPTYTDMLLGMPAETLESWKQGYAELLESGYDNQIDTFFTVLLPNSEMASAATRARYGIKTVEVKDYYTFVPSDHGLDIPNETAEMICSTNTMSHEDMIECYLYAWLINAMHVNGYSQLTAKYCRHAHDVSYRTYYETMQNRLLDAESPLRDTVTSLIASTDSLLRTGRLTEEPEYGITHQFMRGLVEMYDDRERVVEFGFDVARQFCELPDGLIDLQKNLVITEQQPTSWTVDSNLNIDSWQLTDNKITYRLVKRHPEFKPTYYNIVFGRRRGWLKNRIELVV